MTPRPFKTLRSVVAEVFNVPAEKIAGRDTCRRFSVPRQTLAFAAGELAGLNTTQTARLMGQDHTNIVHARKRVARRLEEDEALRRRMGWIRSEYARRMLVTA